MKTVNVIKQAIIIGFCILAFVTKAQLKVTTNGDVGIGVLSPMVKFHVAGDAIFAASSVNPSSSAALIRGGNLYSTRTNPDYTWVGDDRTGLFHPSSGVVAITCLGTEKARFLANNQFVLSLSGSAIANGGVFQNSDRRLKKNIETLVSPLDKLAKLRGVTYEYNVEEFKNYSFPQGSVVGVIAQELQEVLPQAVKEDENGYLAVNYDAIIPLLIESIKDQQKQIEALKQNAAASPKSGNSAAASGASAITKENAAGLDNPVLQQNAPNPFNITTTIRYYIPAAARSANIYVYDISGNKKKSFAINENGQGSIEIAANELDKGIYFYSLVVDGAIKDSKTMLITE